MTQSKRFALVQRSDGISRHGIVSADSPEAALAEYERQLRTCDWHTFTEAEIRDTLASVVPHQLDESDDA